MFPRPLSIITWNVLHRVHAVNWKEPCIEAFPEEKDRNAGIADTVRGWLADNIDAVCMQEVSGDQLAAVRAAVPKDVQIFEHLYPRLPRLRRTDCATLADAKERLVVVVRSGPARLVRSHTFETDPGKGFLVVDLGEGVHLVDTHVSYGPRAPAQLALWKEAALATPYAAIVGDYNAPVETLAAAFGSELTLSDLSGQTTRASRATHIGRTIDHVVVRGGTITAASVLEARGLSDHSPVRATIH